MHHKMLSIYNGTDKPIVINGTTIGLGMSPLITTHTDYHSHFDNVVFAQAKSGYFTVAGDEYRLGDKVDRGTLYITDDGSYTSGETGELVQISHNLTSNYGNFKIFLILILIFILSIVLFILINKIIFI